MINLIVLVVVVAARVSLVYLIVCVFNLIFSLFMFVVSPLFSFLSVVSALFCKEDGIKHFFSIYFYTLSTDFQWDFRHIVLPHLHLHLSLIVFISSLLLLLWFFVYLSLNPSSCVYFLLHWYWSCFFFKFLKQVVITLYLFCFSTTLKAIKD